MSRLGLKMRPELIVADHGSDGERRWVVEDPVTLQFFRLGAQECFVLLALDGHISLAELKRRFENEFYPLRIGKYQLHRFLHHLHQLGLIVSDTSGQGAVLARRALRQSHNTFRSSLLSPLAIRLPGISARRPIDWLYNRLSVLFHPLMLGMYAILVISATALVIVDFDRFLSHLPTVNQFFRWDTMGMFAVALVTTKALHELGHALVCRHVGGRPREIGVMLLAFMPTLYCDVSDVWRVRSTIARIWVSLAGMIVELIVAAIFTLIWWFSEPGPLHDFALRVMFLCSVSTLLFNANPLVRCDGYYILSDLADLPNLWQESRSLWRNRFAAWFMRSPQRQSALIIPAAVPLWMTYAALSTVYCWTLVLGILWLTLQVLQPTGFAVVGWVLAGLAVMGLLMPTLKSLGRAVASPSSRRRLHGGRIHAAVGGILALIAGLFWIPFPRHLDVPFWVQWSDAQPVYVAVAGTLQSSLPEQTQVAAGDVIAQLHNPDVERTLEEVVAELDRRQRHLKSLQTLAISDPSVVPLISVEQEAIDDAQSRYALRRADQQRLTLTAPRDGMVLTAVPRPLPFENASGESQLPSWTGSILDTSNHGAMLEVGETLCMVGVPERFQAILVIDDQQVADVRPGQNARLRIGHAPVRTIRGALKQIAKAQSGDIPTELSRHLLSREQPAAGQPMDARPLYLATVQIDVVDGAVVPMMSGRARIVADWQPLGQRFIRWLQRTFRLR